MGKRRRRLEAFSIAVLLTLQTPAAVWAAEENVDSLPGIETEAAGEYPDDSVTGTAEKYQEDTKEETEEDLTLSGTADLEEGTGNEVLRGTKDAASLASASASEALNKAEAYLQTNVTSPIVGSVGGEWAVLAMARNGMLPADTKSAYLANLYKKLDESGGVLDKRKYTEYSRVTVAVSSIGVDAKDVNGYNMLQPLANFDQVIWQGINGPIWALIAFDTRNYEIPALSEEQAGKTQTTRDGLIAAILLSELEGGGWTLTGSKADTDMTGMALQALAPYKGRADVKAAIDRGLQKLSEIQNENGGFGSVVGEDAGTLESAAQVITALSALDISLLDSDAFTKNGKTVLDALLSFQLEDGSFEHVKGDGSNQMATEQASYALVAWARAVNGQNRLYDMTDVGGQDANQSESEANIEAFRKKLDAFSKTVSIADKEQVYALKTELSQMKKFEEKEAFAERLDGLLKEIEKQEKVVQKLDADIWDQIDPFNISLDDISRVKELMNRYNCLPQENKSYVKNYADLKNADALIQKLKDSVAKADKETESSVAADQKNENTSGGTKTGTAGVAARQTGASGSVSKTSAAATSNTVKAEVKDGIVDKKAFEDIKGKDENLKIEGEISKDKPYTMTINGKDMKKAEDIKAGILEGSPFKEQIQKLADAPYVFHFSEQGKFPGVMQVEMPVDKADGQYLLLKYNEKEQKAEYVQKVEIKDKKTKFLVSEGGSYFIDKKAKTKSLKDLEKEEVKEQPEEEKPKKEISVDDPEEELVLSGTKDEEDSSLGLIAGIAAGILAVGTAAGVGVQHYLKKKRH